MYACFMNQYIENGRDHYSVFIILAAAAAFFTRFIVVCSDCLFDSTVSLVAIAILVAMPNSCDSLLSVGAIQVNRS